MSDIHSASAEPATSRLDLNETEIGSVFVSNYPPYSFWNEDNLQKSLGALNTAAAPDNTLGLYMHIPFCRKRCKFCYFRVYTDKNSTQIQEYVDALAREVEIYSELPAVKGRPLKFIYFGGGTPSYLSVKHLESLVARVKAVLPWDSAEEVTFECEPGTLSQSKLAAIRGMGVTRLSLGIENFDDFILNENGRAHLSQEIYRVQSWIHELDFEQLNVDLIAGMVGETWNTWKENVQKTIDYDPDSVTIYQMELPFNTVYTQMLSDDKQKIHVADWQTKREWHQYAMETLQNAGYKMSSAYTMVKADKQCEFVYRDSVWHGTDMIGAGVAAFGHMNQAHLQNTASWGDYLEPLSQGRLPLKRAFMLSEREQLVREMILQLKLGRIETGYFREKYGQEITNLFEAALQKLAAEGMLAFNDDEIELTPQGLLRVDGLLPEFYDAKYTNARYT